MVSKIFSKIFNLRQFVIFILGFASGLPLLLTGSTFKLWLSQEKIDIKTIGLMSLVGLSYSLKFLWAPLLDRYYLPFLGRRKTWLVLTQLSLALGLFFISQLNPTDHLMMMATWAVFIAFMSATQDITIDAYRTELLTAEETGIGSSVGVYGYRLAMWITGGVLVALVADNSAELSTRISWAGLYQIVAGIFLLLALLSLFIPESKNTIAPKTLAAAVLEPFSDFLKKENAILILLFIFSFKLGDQIAGSLLTPFYKSIGYTNAEIGLVTKTGGLISNLIGFLFGGIALLKFGVRRCLWTFGIFQAISTACFSLLTFTGPVIWSLAVVVFLEDFSGGMATAAFIAYMSSLSNGKYTATQFALLSSLTALGRTLFSGYSGYLQESLGWNGFFYLGAALALPGLFLLFRLNQTEINSSQKT